MLQPINPEDKEHCVLATIRIQSDLATSGAIGVASIECFLIYYVTYGAT